MNISDIISKIKRHNIVTEEDVKIKIVIPVLEKLGYSANDMQFEKNIQVFYGRKTVRIKSDIIVNIVYKNKKTSVMAIEVKSPKTRLGDLEKEQAISYARLHTPPIKFAVVTNGNEWKIFHAGTKKRIKDGVPSVSEFLSAKYELSESQIEESKKFVVEGYKTATEIIKALEKCHNIMRSNDGFTPLDAFDEMNKLIYTKTQAEKREREKKTENRFTKKYFEDECAIIESGKRKIDYDKVKKEMGRIFEDAIEDYKHKEKIFDKKDKIDICGESIYEIVLILDNKGFIQTDYEIMGYAFENFLSTVFRGERLGQYFTPRQIVDFAIDMIEVKIGDRIIDPCFGSGGFLVAAFKILKERIKNGEYNEEQEKKEIKKLCEKSLFGTDINKRLSIACKINMYIHGDGRTEIYHNDGLLDNGHIKENSFDKIFTNPPFGTKISKKEILKTFELAGEHRKMQRSEVLFLERCINLLKPDGEMAIVLPDIILNGANNKKTRKFIFNNCQILAIVSLPSQTFVKSGASVKTSLLFLKKKPLSKICNNKIFMAIPEKVGFDSAGREDESELGKITDSFVEFQKGNEFKEDETAFTVFVKDIADRIDPKVYRPQKEINTEFEIVKLKELVEDLTNTRKFKIKENEKYQEPTISSKTHIISVAREKSGKDLKVKARIKIEKGDLVFSKLHTQNGLFAISDNQFAATNSFLPVKINEEKIYKNYLCEVLSKAVKFLVLEGDSVGRETYKTGQILDLKIPLPSLEYQKILLEKINRQKETSAAMDIAIKNFLEIEEDIFEDFDKVKLGKILTKIDLLKRGKSPVYLQGTNLFILNQKCNRLNNIKMEYAKEVSQEWLKTISTDFFTKEKDVIINSTGEGTIGRASIITKPFENLFYDSHILLVRIKSGVIEPRYLVYYLNGKSGQKEILFNISGESTKQTELGVANLKNLKIPLPPLEIQNKIVEKLDERFAKVKIFKQAKEEAENNRKKIIEKIFK